MIYIQKHDQSDMSLNICRESTFNVANTSGLASINPFPHLIHGCRLSYHGLMPTRSLQLAGILLLLMSSIHILQN